MEKLLDILDEYLTIDCKQVIISNPRRSGKISKIKIRPVLIDNQLYYQATSFAGKQVMHENMDKHTILRDKIPAWMKQFKQLQLIHREETITALVNKKGDVSLSRKKMKTAVPASLSHNRRKRYIIEEGRPVPFLVDLGVMTKEGTVVHKKYDKFRQINRFLEFVRDVEAELPKERPCTIIDFGCGKSYLTFAMYYYLHELCRRQIHMIGLDLKEDVIAHCNALAEKYGYDCLTFLVGDIKDYDGVSAVDMVVTLHACDTATDYALYKAVSWGAKVILSVPCCQHELNAHLYNETLKPMLSYGIIKERFAALATDAMRAQLLTQMGYETQILEFIDMEHTPKNLLIRGVKRGSKLAACDLAAYENFRSFLGSGVALERLLSQEPITANRD